MTALVFIIIAWLVCAYFAYRNFRAGFRDQNGIWTMHDRCCGICLSCFGGPIALIFALLGNAGNSKEVKW